MAGKSSTDKQISAVRVYARHGVANWPDGPTTIVSWIIVRPDGAYYMFHTEYGEPLAPPSSAMLKHHLMREGAEFLARFVHGRREGALDEHATISYELLPEDWDCCGFLRLSAPRRQARSLLDALAALAPKHLPRDSADYQELLDILRKWPVPTRTRRPYYSVNPEIRESP